MLRSFVMLAPAHWPSRFPGPPCARSTRRALATVAEILGLQHAERLPLGSWIDSLGTDKLRLSRMPATYVADETKLWSQFLAKRQVADVVGHQLQRLAPAQFGGTAWDGWFADSLRAAFCLVGTAVTPTTATPCPTTRPVPAASQPAASSSASQQPQPEVPASCSSSSSSSDSSSEQVPEEVQWILHIRERGGPAFLHRSTMVSQDGVDTRRPVCCQPRTTSVTHGTGLSAAIAAAEPFGAQWCRRCAGDLYVAV